MKLVVTVAQTINRSETCISGTREQRVAAERRQKVVATCRQQPVTDRSHEKSMKFDGSIYGDSHHEVMNGSAAALLSATTAVLHGLRCHYHSARMAVHNAGATAPSGRASRCLFQ